MVDYLLFNPLDLLNSPFGDPLPSTLHAVSLLDRTFRILKVIEQISSGRRHRWAPRFIWEPYYVSPSRQAQNRSSESRLTGAQADTTPHNWPHFTELVPRVDIFRYDPRGQLGLTCSPNHVEAFQLCSMPPPSAESLTESVELACKALSQLKPRTATIIRAGAHGACYILANNPGQTHWVPAYWSDDQSRVVDPTGAGNGFLGGLAAALDEGLDVHTGESYMIRTSENQV